MIALLLTAVLVLSLGSITIAAPAVSEEIILTEEPTGEMPDYEESAETPILIPEEPADEMPLPDFEESAETPLQLMEDSGAGEGTPAKRTIMMYICGSNLESRYSMASYNLRQILSTNFSTDEDVKFVVMTAAPIVGF